MRSLPGRWWSRGEIRAWPGRDPVIGLLTVSSRRAAPLGDRLPTTSQATPPTTDRNVRRSSQTTPQPAAGPCARSRRAQDVGGDDRAAPGPRPHQGALAHPPSAGARGRLRPRPLAQAAAGDRLKLVPSKQSRRTGLLASMPDGRPDAPTRRPRVSRATTRAGLSEPSRPSTRCAPSAPAHSGTRRRRRTSRAEAPWLWWRHRN